MRAAVVAAALAVAVTLIQLGVVPALFLRPAAAPLLPVALIAAWSAARGGRETWPVLLLAPAMLGVASTERTGWFLLALLPTAAIALFAGSAHGARRFQLAPAIAAAGAICYLAVLAAAAGRPGALAVETWAVAASALWTAAAAALLAVILRQPRARPARLFR